VAVFLGPALLAYGLLFVVPIFWSMGYTLFVGSPISGFRFAGLTNYLTLLDDDAFWRAMSFTLRFAIADTIGQVGFGLLLAFLYVFYLSKSSGLIRTLFFFPVIVPTIAVAQLFVKIFQLTPHYGLVNSILSVLGGEPLTSDWLGSPAGAFWVLLALEIWRAMGFYAILLYAGLVDISQDVLEAARIDGASTTQLIRMIALPLLRPVLVSSIILAINGTLKAFDTIVALTNGGPGDATTPLTLLMYNNAFNYGNFGYGSTVAFSLLTLSGLATLLVFRQARRDTGK
jgi:ABC-type sugar transport system permease subunit